MKTHQQTASRGTIELELNSLRAITLKAHLNPTPASETPHHFILALQPLRNFP